MISLKIRHILLLMLTAVLFSCGGSNTSKNADLPKDMRVFEPYIDYHQDGLISRKDGIGIRFMKDVTLTDEQLSSVFSIKPSVEGKIIKIDEKLITFQPKDWLQSGTLYTISVNLTELFDDVPEEAEKFSFEVQTITQAFDLETEQLEPYNDEDWTLQQFQGTINIADVANNNDIEKMLTYNYPPAGVSLEWTHSEKKHTFLLRNVQRQKEKEFLEIKVDGSPINVSYDEKRKVVVPSIGTFDLISAEVIMDGAPYISLKFSDPVKENQDFKGLISVGNEDNIRFEVDMNEVKGYFDKKLNGSKVLRVAPGIKSRLNTAYKSEYTEELAFEVLKPAVKFVSNGNYIPSNGDAKLTFKAVNLKAVELSVTEIFEQNVPQFFQTNTIEGKNQIKRVAKPILTTTISLGDSLTDFSNWTTYDVALGKMINNKKGAIYQVSLSFGQEHTSLDCVAPVKNQTEQQESAFKQWKSEHQAFNTYNSYYDDDYYPSGYDWRERENPCHVSYYSYDKRITRNVIATNVGLIAKVGRDQSVNIITTDLINAQPLAGATVKVLNFQMQELAAGETNESGVANFSPDERPFLIIAENNGQYAYLKLTDGASLSLSNFDVSGSTTRSGLKGFIYGERGVWRPGNTIHLNFILEDDSDLIPDNYPVQFTLKDPFGNIKDKAIISASRLGMYGFTTKTNDEDPTGNWSVDVSIGNTVFSKMIKIETVKPNRLKINLDFGKKLFTAKDKNITSDLKVNWLTGLPGKELKANFNLLLTKLPVNFTGFEAFSFVDNSKSFTYSEENIFSGKLNQDGNASISVDLGTMTDVPGALRATFKGKVFEPGGNFSIDQFSIPYYPYEHYVGVKMKGMDKRGRLESEDRYTIEVASLTADGKKTSRNNIEVEVRKIEWRWWWDEYEGRSNYINNRHGRLIYNGKVNTTNGLASVSFKTDSRWGRFRVIVRDKASGHSASKTFYLYSYRWQDSGEEGLGATYLAFNADKEVYKVGEKVNLSIPGSKQGKALISIENGKKVLKTYWIDTEDKPTNFSFDVTDDMSPNVYISLALMQPYAQSNNDLPIRLYGIAPIEVTNDNAKLIPVIDLPKKVAPQEDFSVSIREESGKEMAYTLAIVDEGLLDITKYKTPQPSTYFYAREALGVRTWDIFDHVAGKYTGKIEKLLSIGGDGSNEEDKSSKANRFKPVVLYTGPFYLKGGGRRTHKFTMPEYIGSVKVMVIAANAPKKSYGQAEALLPVTQPIMIQGTMPRVVGPGERLKLPVNLFALEDNIGKVSIEVKTEGVLKVKGSTQKSISINKRGDLMEYFDLEVMNKAGIGKVIMTAKAKGKTSTSTIEINSRIPNPAISEKFSFSIEEGKQIDKSIAWVGAEGTNEMTIEVSSMPSLDLQKRLDYLIRYPHGCLEQTVSGAFPQLFLSQLVKLSAEEKAKTDHYIKTAIKKIRYFQTRSGGLALWQGIQDVSYWANNYAGHFLIEARARGYVVPAGVFNQWKNYQTSQAQQWTTSDKDYNGDLIQAYRLYTLALNNTPQLGAMNRLRETNGLNPMAYWILADAYLAIGRKDVASKIVANRTVDYSQRKKYPYYFSYGSALRDQSIVLNVLNGIGSKSVAIGVAKNLAEKIGAQYWMSTQTTSFALMAVSRFYGEGEKELRAEANFNTGERKTVAASQRIATIPVPIGEKSPVSFQLANRGKGSMYVTVHSSGKPIEGKEKANSSNISLKVSYINRAGIQISPDTLEQGEDFKVLVTIKNMSYKGYIRDLALTQIFPSGWEINNDRLNNTGNPNAINYTYRDIRDDRVYTYFNLPSGGSKTFEVKLTATYEGHFYLPSFKVEAMYDNDIFANNKGKWVEVVPPTE